MMISAKNDQAGKVSCLSNVILCCISVLGHMIYNSCIIERESIAHTDWVISVTHFCQSFRCDHDELQLDYVYVVHPVVDLEILKGVSIFWKFRPIKGLRNFQGTFQLF